MDPSEGWFGGIRGARLYYQRWRRASTPTRGVLVMVHGDWAHSGWYMNLPLHETPRGYAVYAYDRRGWGRSLPESGYPRSWSDHLDDLAAFLALVHAEEPERPLFLIGHTGSAPLVLDYAMRRPDEIRGVCCVSPALDTSAAIPGALRMLLRVLSVVAPRLTIDVRRRVDAGMASISHDAAFVQAAREDPLRNTRVLPRLLVVADPVTERVLAQAPQFQTPLLLLLGGADRMLPSAASQAYFERVGPSDKELRVYPGAYTNLLSETVTPEVLGDLDRWLDRHVI
ncbi:MAG TPA: lysophospholipase [Ktedonobacterales bacterium]